MLISRWCCRMNYVGCGRCGTEANVRTQREFRSYTHVIRNIVLIDKPTIPNTRYSYSHITRVTTTISSYPSCIIIFEKPGGNCIIGPVWNGHAQIDSDTAYKTRKYVKAWCIKEITFPCSPSVALMSPNRCVVHAHWLALKHGQTSHYPSFYINGH